MLEGTAGRRCKTDRRQTCFQAGDRFSSRFAPPRKPAWPRA